MLQKLPLNKTKKSSTPATKNTKRIPELIKSKHLTPNKQKRSNTGFKNSNQYIENSARRLCIETKRLSTCETKQMIKVTEIIKVSHAKEKDTKRNSIMTEPMIGVILVSPIQKINITFVNKEDQSLIRALEIL